MNPRQSPGLGYKRVMSCKDSLHVSDLLAVAEHAPRLTAVRWQADRGSPLRDPLERRRGKLACQPEEALRLGRLRDPRQAVSCKELLMHKTLPACMRTSAFPSLKTSVRERKTTLPPAFRERAGFLTRETIERRAASEN